MWERRVLCILAILANFHSLAVAQNSTAYSILSSECISYISAFPPTVSLYAFQLCQVCQGLQLSPSIEPCCSAANPTACFASSFYHLSVSDATITAAPTLMTSTGSTTMLGYYGNTNCDSVISILENCEAATPGFDNLCFHYQQACFCSTSGTWAPSIYDDYWSSCLAWASTANPSYYSDLGPGTNGVVQSRKCQTWEQLTATGGTPSDCLTSPSNTLSPTSLAPARASSITSTGAAAEITDMHVSFNLLYLSLIFRS